MIRHRWGYVNVVDGITMHISQESLLRQRGYNVDR
jgi:hypothetical protein